MIDEGRFQVGAGIVLRNRSNAKILLIHRHCDQYDGDQWEIPAGRLQQFESIESGLRRELLEETGITDVHIGRILRAFEYMRGDRRAENEVIGIVFEGYTSQEDITLSDEHDDYKWLTLDEAIELATIPGVKKDLLAYQAI